MNAAPVYMDIVTGRIDTEAGWLYIDEAGDLVSAVGMGEAVQVERDSRGKWKKARSEKAV
jgi:hypothetical protein